MLRRIGPQALAVIVCAAALLLPVTPQAQTSADATDSAQPALNAVDARRLETLQAQRTQTEIERTSAALYLAKLRNDRENWRVLADYARSDPTPGAAERLQRRQENVTRYDSRIAQSEESLRQLNAEIAELGTQIEALTARAEATAPDPQAPYAEPEDDRTNLGMGMIAGYWEDTETGQIFGLMPDDPTLRRSNRISLHTDTRVWRGLYEDRPPDDPERVQDTTLEFRYKPQPDEMNPRLPEWVRAAIAGELEWRIKLDEICCPYLLRGTFDPGKVTYPETGRDPDAITVENGKGTARDLELDIAETPVSAAVGAAELDIVPIGSDILANLTRRTTAEGAPVALEEQPLQLRAVLNTVAYREQGRPATLTARLTNPDTGDTATVTLKRKEPVLPHLVIYTSEGLISFGDSGDATPGRDPNFLTTDWMNEVFGGPAGSKINLGIRDKGRVRIEALDQAIELTIVDRITTLMVEQRLKQLELLEAQWAADDARADQPRQSWIDNFSRRAMAQNLRTVLTNIDRQGPANGRIREELQLVALDFYLGANFIDMPADRASSVVEDWFNPVPRGARAVNARTLATDEGKYLRGVSWAVEGERRLWQSLRNYREEKFGEIALSAWKMVGELSYQTMVELVSNATGISLDLTYIANTGTNLMGQRVSDAQFRTMVVQNYASWASDRYLAYARATAAPRGPRPRQSASEIFRNAGETALWRWENTSPLLRGKMPALSDTTAIAAKRGMLEHDALPSGLPANRPASARAVENEVLHGPLEAHVTQRVNDNDGARIAAAEAPEGRIIAAPDGDVQPGTKYYPKYEVTLANDGPAQMRCGCLFEGTMAAALSYFGIQFNNIKAGLLASIFRIPPRVNVSWRFAEVQLLLQRLGFEVPEPEVGKFKLERIEQYLNQRWEVGVSVRGGDTVNHYVHVMQIIRDPSGQKITHVIFRETSTKTGRAELRRMEADDFLGWMGRRYLTNASNTEAVQINQMQLYRFRAPDPNAPRSGFSAEHVANVRRFEGINLADPPQNTLPSSAWIAELSQRRTLAQEAFDERQANIVRVEEQRRADAALAKRVRSGDMMRDLVDLDFLNEHKERVSAAIAELTQRLSDETIQTVAQGLSPADRNLATAAALQRAGINLSGSGLIERMADQRGQTPAAVLAEVNTYANSFFFE